MRKISLFILVTLQFYACQDNVKNNEVIYTAVGDFGEVENQIPFEILDSLILNHGYTRLSNYQNRDSIFQTASNILVNELKSHQIDKEKLLISKVRKDNNSIVTFEMSHMDYLVYFYNWESKNKELKAHPNADKSYSLIPPVTGNVSGYEGYYSVDVVNHTLQIAYFQ